MTQAMAGVQPSAATPLAGWVSRYSSTATVAVPDGPEPPQAQPA